MDRAELIATARTLSGGRTPSGCGHPNQADLRRALSAIYHAALHALAGNNAYSLTWPTTPARRNPAWAPGHRAIDRRTAGNAANPKG